MNDKAKPCHRLPFCSDSTAAFSGMPSGPSAVSVIHLSANGTSCASSEGTSAPLPAPPLQRPTKVHLKPALQISASDCLEMHCAQIETRQAERVAATHAARKQHIQDMRELKGRVAHAYEEEASRRSWHRQVATEQLIQTEEKSAAELQAYKESHLPIEYWPYEADKPGFVPPEKKVYGAELLLAAQQKANAKALQKLAQQRGLGGTTLRLRAERLREQAAVEAQSVGRVAPHEVQRSMAEADRKRREAVASQAELRLHSGRSKLGAAASSGALGAGLFGEVDTSKYQLKEASRELREHANKQQMREVLTYQMEQKRLRELEQHAHTYGPSAEYESALAKMMEKAAGAKTLSRVDQAKQGQQRRAELERAIQQKQRERRELRRLAQEEQRRLDDDAAATEALMHERDRMRQSEQRTQMQIDMLAQEAAAKRSYAKEQLANTK